MGVYKGLSEVNQMLELYQTNLSGEARDRPSRRRSRSRRGSRSRRDSQ